MNWTLFWVFVPMETMLCLTPGPAVLLVLATALRRGARRSVFTTLGILSANTLYFAASATSIGALLVSSYRIFFLVKWIGAAYLVFLGLKALLGKSDALSLADKGGIDVRPARRLFLDGLTLQLSNPKALVFFTALLPQFIVPRKSAMVQIAALAVVSVAIEFCVLAAYGVMAGKALAIAREPRYSVWTNRISGTLLIGAGGGLALLRRD